MVTFSSALVGVAIIYSVSSLAGYVTLQRLMGRRLSPYPFFARLPLYTAFGITILIPIFLAAAFLELSILTIIAVLLFSIACIAWSLKSEFSEKKRHLPRIFLSRDRLLDTILPFILFIATAAYFLLIVDRIRWPFPGDIETGIGPLVSLIESAGKVPIEPSPILILYPPGFHATTATFNILLRLYPAEAVFLMGASTIILIPQLLYSLTYFVTRSKAFSTVAFLSSLLVHPSTHMEKWVGGYFFNGPYPCLTGFLVVLVFTNIATLLSIEGSGKDSKNIAVTLTVGFLASISLILTYPSFALLTLAYTLMIIAFWSRTIWQECKAFSKRLNASPVYKVMIAAVILLTIAILYGLISTNHYAFGTLLSYLKGSYYPGGVGIGDVETKYAYLLSPSFLFDNVNGIMVIIAYPLAIYLALKSRRFHLPLFYLTIGTLVFASMSVMIYQLIFIVLPTRTVIILSLLAGPLILIAIDEMMKSRGSLLVKNIGFRIGNRTKTTKRQVILRLAIAAVALAAFVPYLYGYFMFSNPPWIADDFAALEWINTNVDATDLILNDASHASMYLWSMSIKNITHHLWTQYVYSERFNDLLEVWKNPQNAQYMSSVLEEYDVKYVFSTSELGYQLYGPRHGYYDKHFTPAQYAEIFGQHEFLEPVFESGSTRVYKVRVTVAQS